MQFLKNTWQFILILFMLCSADLTGQIMVPDADFFDTTEYVNDDLGEHLIAIFSPKLGGYPENVELIADFTDTVGLNYKWLKLNEAAFVFDSLAYDANTTASSYVISGTTGNDDEDGCYKLEITGAGFDTAFYMWVYVSTFQINNIIIKSSDCENMQLEADLDIDSGFEYFDLVDFSPLTLEHDYEIFWETIPEIDSLRLDNELDPTFTAPTEYLIFKLEMQDNFGKIINKSLDIEEVELDDNRVWLRAAKADFEASRTGILEGDSITGGPAPLSMQFINNSENATEFFWSFYNDYTWVDEALLDTTILTSEFETPVDSIIYYYPAYFRNVLDKVPGAYDVLLKVKGPVYIINGQEFQCEDSILKKDYIRVDSTFVPEFANVFTPNGDGNNEIFYFKEGLNDSGESTSRIKHNLSRSIRKFSIKIYSRWGDKVYDYEGNVLDWNGWDGTTLGNLRAKTGVYYYSAFVTGWDGHTYNEKGFVHLFRTKY